MTHDMTETEPLAGADEDTLRALYRELAPAQIETERAWAATAAKLALRPAAIEERGVAARRARNTGRRAGWRARLGVAAALLALPVALMGAGLVKEQLMALDTGMQRIADEGLYQDVNQSQTLDGITITLTAAYADEGRTVFYYHVQMSPALARQHQSALIGSWELTDAQGSQPASVAPGTSGLGTCSAWDSVTDSIACYQIQQPFQPRAVAQRIALTLDITRVYLPLRASNGYDQLSGHWRFQFTIPYHHLNIGSAGQFFPHLLHLAPTSPEP